MENGFVRMDFFVRAKVPIPPVPESARRNLVLLYTGRRLTFFLPSINPMAVPSSFASVLVARKPYQAPSGT